LQHVLEHGKPDERSAIISKLTGKIVKMSQQKFASNVIEKCLAFGDATERSTMVNEMLGSTDENEPLQVDLLSFHSMLSLIKCVSPPQFVVCTDKSDIENYIAPLSSCLCICRSCSVFKFQTPNLDER